MIIPEEEIEEQFDRSTAPTMTTTITDLPPRDEKSDESKPKTTPSPPPANKEEAKKTTSATKNPETGPQHVCNDNLFGLRGILGMALVCIAMTSNVIPPTLSKWFMDYYDLPVITPYFSVYSATADPLRFDPVSSPFNISTSTNVTARWNISFNVTNPSSNHVLDYTNLVVIITYSSNSPLWVTMIPAFQQVERMQDLVNATFAAVPVTVDNSLALAMLGDVTSSGSGSFSEFTVRILGNVRQMKLGTKKHKRDAGVLSAVCKMDVEFFQRASVVAEASRGEVCKVSVVENGLESWIELAMYTILAYATFRFTHKSSQWAFTHKSSQWAFPTY